MASDRDIAQRKYEMLIRAYEQAQKGDEALDELKSAAFEVLLLNPGCDFDEWRHILIEQYGTELIDAYAPSLDPENVLDELCNFWESPYYDKASGLEKDYKEWAEAFATEQAVDVYYELIDLKKRI